MLRLAAEAGSVGIWEWDQGLDVLTVSEEMERQVGSKLKRPGDLRQFIHKDDYPAVRWTMLEAKRYSTPFEIEYRVESADGDTRWILNKGTTLCRTTESSRHMVGVSIDISRTKRSEEKYRHLAHHDPLTSLPNRRKMKQWLRQFSDSKQAGDALLGIVSIDYFARINDVYGQAVGNSLLKQVANRLAEHVQAADFVCRYGADTFLIVHSIEDVDCPQKRFSQLLYSISKSYDIDGLQLKAGFSSGLITLNAFGFDWQESINGAEIALARSKSSRRGSITVYEESMAKISARFETVRNELHHAIERNELFVVFQPLMEISNSGVAGFEALVRWDSPRLGSVSPVEFIPLAEKTGLIDAVSTVVLKHISSQIRDWKRRGYCVPPISFNLSPSTLENVDGAEKFLIQLETYGLCPGDLVLEFTETAVIHNEEVVAENIRVLARHGFRIALDDFGTGYSSLENLYKLHISKLKIDKSFVFKIKGSVKHANIVRGLISMARSIDLNVIAEGVESEDQLEMLREWGCDMAQGYIFAKPMLPADAERYLEAA
nr:GGDEF domain-containing phosphodiesterase [Litorivivens lipolytica]